MFSESKLETKDNAAIEHLKRNNRVMQSLKLNCSGVVNLKQKFESWDDNLYKNENGTSGVSEVPVQGTGTVKAVGSAPRKRHLVSRHDLFGRVPRAVASFFLSQYITLVLFNSDL